MVERVAATYAEVPPIDQDLALLDLPRREVLDALAALPASYRDALVLRYVDELSFHDVAEVTGISEGNARLRVHRGRAALRRALAPFTGVIVFLAPFLRRGQRAALATQLSADTHVALVASSPAATRVAEQGMVFVDRAPSLPGMIGVAASLVVPAAIPVIGNQVANRGRRRLLRRWRRRCLRRERHPRMRRPGPTRRVPRRPPATSPRPRRWPPP